jgi:hypothetical protein
MKYINIKKILNTPSLCNNMMSRRSLVIKDAHSQKKEEKKETPPK